MLGRSGQSGRLLVLARRQDSDAMVGGVNVVGECSSGVAEGAGTITWRICVWDNGGCLPWLQMESGSFLNGWRAGRVD